MAFTGIDDLVVALAAASDVQINHAGLTGQVAGGYSSFWRTTGLRQGAIPGAAAVCTDALAGAMPLPTRSGGQERALAFAALSSTVAGTTFFFDRLAHMGGMSGTVTTAQTANVDVTGAGSNLPARIGATNYSNTRWFLEWFGQTGGTGVNATCAVTYDDASTGNIVVAVPATTALHRMIEIIPTNGKYIRSIQSVTLSATTGTAGSFGVTAVRDLGAMPHVLANRIEIADWAALGLQKVEDSACVFLAALLTSATLPAVTGRARMAVA